MDALVHMIDNPSLSSISVDSGLQTDTSTQNLARAVTYDGVRMANGRKKFLFCAAGVFVSYFYYGILQETM